MLLAGGIVITTAAAGWGEETVPPNLAELTIEELMNVTVYGASKFEQKLSEAPASVTVVTSDEIKKYGYRTLADIIRGQRGFQVSYDRNYSYVGVRGFGRTGDYNSRILLILDGHRINENIYDSISVGNEELLDVDLIDRVEFIRGAGSSLYGNNAFFGVINIISRKGVDFKGTELAGSAGSLDSYKGRASYGDSHPSGLAALISGSIYDSAGNKRLFYPEFNDPATNNGVAQDLDYERSYNLLGTFSYRDFTLQGAYVGREKAVPTASFGTVFNDPRYKTFDYRGYLDLKYGHAFGSLGVLARLFFDHYDYYSKSPYDLAAAGDPPNVVMNRDSADNNWWGSELQLTRTFLQKHRVIGGGEYQGNLTQRQDNYDIDPYFKYLDTSHLTKKWALYLQDEYTILPNLVLNAGVRYDHFDTFGAAVSPRAALIYSPVDKTSFKLIYGEAFRAPNSYELFYDVPAFDQKGNPALKPEKIRSYELVFEQLLGDHLRLIVNSFTSRIDNLISQQTDADDMLVFRNVAGAETTGVGTEIEGLWANGFKGNLSYTYQEARDSDTDDILVNSPQHMVKGRLTIPLVADKLFAGPELQYMSSRKTLGGNKLNGFVVANLTVFSQKLLPGLELSGSAYNLFDTRYRDPGGADLTQDSIEQDGRTFRVKLTYRF